MTLVYCSLAFVAFLAVSALSELHPLSDEYIAEINKKQSSWKAGRNFDIHEWEKVKRISSGAFLSERSKKNAKIHIHNENQPIPEFYDFRQSYPKCNTIKDINDQANCGSCYAFSAVEAMSDRICIQSNQTKQVRVSIEDALTCNQGFGGCNGGDTYSVYEMWANQGITSGGHYNNTKQGCKPYFLPECGQNCPTTTADTPACEKTCADPNLNYESELTFGQKDIYMFKNATQIQLEMLKNGPVSTTFLVPSDFPNYKSGIYQKTTDLIVGIHCLKFIGWGVEDGLKYWIVANSWGKSWGENGFFRIIRGRNESGIEGAVIAASPKLDLSFNQN